VPIRSDFNEWTYNFNGTPYRCSDNTTINAKEKQSVDFLGASYVYKFQSSDGSCSPELTGAGGCRHSGAGFSGPVFFALRREI
jgi:hypothetical protein